VGHFLTMASSGSTRSTWPELASIGDTAFAAES
jgi:hypothetical protein